MVGLINESIKCFFNDSFAVKNIAKKLTEDQLLSSKHLGLSHRLFLLFSLNQSQFFQLSPKYECMKDNFSSKKL